jgi:glycosyltransferase involved in cell wall biosynthesis
MKVWVIAGSLPPDVCGVGDFTGAIIEALRSRGIEVVVKYRKPWRLRDIPGLVRALWTERPDVVHLQYPTHGFRRSIVPHLLHLCMLGWPRVTTLHDYAGQRWPIRLSMSAFAWSGRIIVNGALDQKAFVRWHPWMASRVSVVPIGSNMPGGTWEPTGPFTIVHFGMLRPDKGLEQMIELARLCRQANRPYRCVIVGAAVPHIRDYAESLFRQAEGTGLEWRGGVPPEEVSEILRHAHVAYLAPVCGIHERRGSLLACVANGLPVVAKVDWETPDFLRGYVIAANTAQEALQAIDQLQDPSRLAEQHQRSLALDAMFSWDTIAELYIGILMRAAAAGALPEREEPAPAHAPRPAPTTADTELPAR